jgi:endonuclease VIII
MPEGDTIHRAARRIEAALVGSRIVEIETPQPRHRKDRWPERLDGRAVRAVEARGKHLFVRFEGDLAHEARHGMLASVHGARQPRELRIYERAGRPCRRCGTPIRARGQGDDNRTTYWCPGCQG